MLLMQCVTCTRSYSTDKTCSDSHGWENWVSQMIWKAATFIEKKRTNPLSVLISPRLGPWSWRPEHSWILFQNCPLSHTCNVTSQTRSWPVTLRPASEPRTCVCAHTSPLLLSYPLAMSAPPAEVTQGPLSCSCPGAGLSLLLSPPSAALPFLQDRISGSFTSHTNTA